MSTPTPADDRPLDGNSLLLEAVAKLGPPQINHVLRHAPRVREKASAPELRRHAAEIDTMLAMLRHHLSGRDPQLPAGAMTLIGAALFYLLAPVDLIPDFIPHSGFLDDLAVLDACLRLVRGEITRFRERSAAGD